MAEDRLTQEEVALVLRRAAELDMPAAGTIADERLPVAAVEAAAAEVGLPAAAVRQAVAELRSGVLTDDGASAAARSPAVVIEAAVVPYELEVATAEIGRWLTAQTFQRHRGRDGVEVWRVREDLIAGLQRSLDWSASVRLRRVREVVVRAVPVEGGTLLRLEASLGGGAAAAPTIGAAGGAVAGTSVATVGLTVGSATITGLGAGLAGMGSVAGWLGGRQLRRARLDRIADELAAELDRVATGQRAKSALDRFRTKARRERGEPA